MVVFCRGMDFMVLYFGGTCCLVIRFVPGMLRCGKFNYLVINVITISWSNFKSIPYIKIAMKRWESWHGDIFTMFISHEKFIWKLRNCVVYILDWESKINSRRRRFWPLDPNHSYSKQTINHLIWIFKLCLRSFLIPSNCYFDVAILVVDIPWILILCRMLQHSNHFPLANAAIHHRSSQESSIKPF